MLVPPHCFSRTHCDFFLTPFPFIKAKSLPEGEVKSGSGILSGQCVALPDYARETPAVDIYLKSLHKAQHRIYPDCPSVKSNVFLRRPWVIFKVSSLDLKPSNEALPMVNCPCEPSAQSLHAQISHPQVPSWTCRYHQWCSEPFTCINLTHHLPALSPPATLTCKVQSFLGLENNGNDSAAWA